MKTMEAIAFVKAFHPDLPEWQIKILAKMVEHQGPIIFKPMPKAEIYKIIEAAWKRSNRG